MDKYLELIAQEEEKVGVLENRKAEILDANRIYSEKEKGLDKKEESLSQQRGKYQKIKYYLENSKSCRKAFLKKAIAFGIKCSATFMSFIIAISLLIENVSSIPLLKCFVSFLGVSVLLGIVEYRNVSREYNHLLGDYRGNIDEDLQANEGELDSVKKEKIKVKNAIYANEELLKEIEGVLQSLKEEVLLYRNARNNLIEKLIGELDNYIVEQNFPEIDIHKVIEKKIQ